MSAFVDKIQLACQTTRSLVCVGLDPDPAQMPVADVFEFNRAIVDATSVVACAYKPNLAFYEALGADGLAALERTVAHIRRVAGDTLIIGDAKRGDIGPSARAYAKAMFEVWGFDAVTGNAWGGSDSVEPFLEDERRGLFVWCRGSNLGSGDFQDLVIEGGGAPAPLYERMASACSQWNTRGNVGLVVGATVPGQLAAVRGLCPDMPLLVPGVGAQGGELETAVRAGIDAAGRMALFNSSRGITYASGGPDFAEAAGEAALNLRNAINAVLDEEGLGWPSS
jgi:orotidine-5'-phosphate decarboxylase